LHGFFVFMAQGLHGFFVCAKAISTGRAKVITNANTANQASIRFSILFLSALKDMLRETAARTAPSLVWAGVPAGSIVLNV
jgi:hypothetical protein